MLELKNLTFEVPLADGSKNTKRIIDDLSLTIPDGRFTVITGPNGGGKSTLAKLIMGVERATSGQILLDGDDITSLSISERANKGIGYGLLRYLGTADAQAALHELAQPQVTFNYLGQRNDGQVIGEF